MKKRIDKKQCFSCVMLAALGMQFIIIFCTNYFKAEKFLDFDAAMAVRHAVEMWRNNTIFLQNFGYTTSMEIDCASFFAAPIYMLTGSYGLGVAIAHLVLDGILAYAIYNLLKNIDVTYEFRILGILLVFLPYQAGQLSWDNMLFLSVGQYEFRATAAVLLFMLFSSKGKFAVKQWIELAVCEFYIALTVLSAGNYLLIILLIPVALYEVFVILTKQKIDLKDRTLRITVLSMAVGCSAFMLRGAMNISTHRGNMNIIKETEFANNILSCITGAFALFGGLPNYDLAIFTVEGIGLLTRFVVSCVIFGMGIVAFRSIGRMENQCRNFMMRFLFLLGVNMFVFLYSNTTYGSAVFEYRYHIVWSILLIIIDIMFLAKKWDQIGKWKKNALIFCIAMSIIVIDISGFGKLAKENWLNEGVINFIIEKANERDVSNIVVADGVTARQMSAVDINKNVQFAILNEDDGSIVFNTWGSSMDTHVDAKNIMVIKDEDLEKLSQSIRSAYTEVDTFEGWYILYTEDYAWN